MTSSDSRSVADFFDQLPSAANGAEGVFEAVPLPEHEAAYAARDSNNRPAVLTTATGVAADVQLRSVAARHGVNATLRTGPHSRGRTRFSIISCDSDDLEVQRLFLTVVVNALPSSEAERSAAGINRLMGRFESLFAALTRPGRPPSGLWAELLLIARSLEARRLLAAWHVAGDDTFDFSEGSERLEIKSVSRVPRWHNFSMEQLSPPDGVLVSVVSVIVEPRSTGTPLHELRQAALDAAGEDATLRQKVDELCVEYLGDAWSQSQHLSFDEAAALRSLRVYNAPDVPRIPGPAPAGVSSVHFKSNVDLAPQLNETQLVERPLAGSAIAGRATTPQSG